MKIFNNHNNEPLSAQIVPLLARDFTIIKRSKQYVFDWSLYEGKMVYKLMLKGASIILGLVCYTDGGKDYQALKIELLEVGKANVGRNKEINGIGGCLIAFVCRASIKLGYGGWVCLVPKTGLINYYCEMYGFVNIGPMLVADSKAAQNIINKYY